MIPIRSTPLFLLCLGVFTLAPIHSITADDSLSQHPFGKKFAKLDSLATGKWWEKPKPALVNRNKVEITMHVERDQVVAFALYLQDRGVLKLTAKLFPLMPD